MTVIIKEIRVNTVIEKKVVQATEVSDDVYKKMKEEIIRELSTQGTSSREPYTSVKKNER